MKKLLTALISTVVLNLGFAQTARAFPFTFPEPSAPPSIFAAPPAPPLPFSLFSAPPAPPLPPAPPAPFVPPLFTPVAEVSEPTDVTWCKINDPIGATNALSNPAKACVASSVPEAFSRLATFTTGNPQPAIEAAQCLKNRYPQDYNKALNFVEITGDCKVYGD